VTIALAVPWCPWIPERVESMNRLRAALGVSQDEKANRLLMPYREFTDRAPNDEWSEKVWEWLSTTSAEWCLQLQEDALVAPNFWPALHAILEALPEDADVVGLQVPHRAAPSLAREGVRLFTTADALIGVGYVVRRSALFDFLIWRGTQLRAGWRKPVPPKNLPELTEDTLLGVWCLATGRRIYHPIPTIVDHDVSMQSVWGNDDHPNRVATVRWDGDLGNALKRWTPADLEVPAWWCGDQFKHPGDVLRRAAIPHLGRFYDATPLLALKWVEGFTTADFQRARVDTGASELRRLAHAERGRHDFKALATALVCTPIRGKPAPEHQRSMIQLVHDEAIELLDPTDVVALKSLQETLVLTRSRHARAVVESGSDVGIQVDGDVSCESGMIRRMVAAVMAGKDIVCAPYPRRDGVHFESVAQHDPLGRPPESRAYRYDMKLLPDAPKFKAIDELGAYLLEKGEADGCVEVESMPIGCSVIRRTVFERMIEAYRGELEIDDELEGVRAPLVLLFMVKLRDRKLVHDDVAFLERARAIGIKVHAYFGPGSPATHHGTHAFAGNVASFGLYRVEGDRAAPPAT
jgi:hypothetical protein